MLDAYIFTLIIKVEKNNYHTFLFIAGTYPDEEQVVIWFQDDDKYSIVEHKKIMEKPAKLQQSVTFKGATRRWTGHIYRYI